MRDVIPNVYEATSNNQRKRRFRALVQHCNQVVLNLERRSGAPFRNLVPFNRVTNCPLMRSSRNGGWSSDDEGPFRGSHGLEVIPLPVSSLERSDIVSTVEARREDRDPTSSTISSTRTLPRAEGPERDDK